MTKGTVAEAPIARALLKQLKREHAEILDRCEYGIADRGYDDGKLIEKLWDAYGIKPVIDIRGCGRMGRRRRR